MRAPAKLNLCLLVGPIRPEDGRHQLVSVFQPLLLADEVTVFESERDEVVCPGIEGPNLAEAALRRLREAGWEHSPIRVEINKRIPVAAGLGGGSADAAAVLRLAEGEVNGLEEIAAGLGADVPSQIRPRTNLVSGAGEALEPFSLDDGFSLVLVPDARGLSAGDVYAEADRLGGLRSESELRERHAELETGLARRNPLECADLLVNDLEPAAISLMPEIDSALEALRNAGARHAMVTGSGPTAVGLFEGPYAADRAAAELGPRFPGVLVTGPARAGGA